MSSSLTVPSFREDQIGRLDVAMDDAPRMQICEPGCGLADIVGRLGNGKRPVLLHKAEKVCPFDVFEHQVGDLG